MAIGNVFSGLELNFIKQHKKISNVAEGYQGPFQYKSNHIAIPVLRQDNHMTIISYNWNLNLYMNL